MEPPIFPLSNGHGCSDFAGSLFSLGFSYAFLGIVRFTRSPQSPPRAAVPRFLGAIVFDFFSLGGVAACCYVLLQSSSIFNPTWPHLGPQVGLYKPIFCFSFSDHLSNSDPTSFWSDFGPQIDVKIDQKSIKKFFQNQPTNQSYFSFIFNQISKTISCSSKMVDFRKSFQNLVFL